MKELSLSQDDIDVLWSAIINQASVEQVLMKSVEEFEDFQRHIHREMACCSLKDKLYKMGVTGIS